MPQCQECKFFKANEEDVAKGTCFGHDVEAETDAASCPTQSFQPKEEEKTE